MKLQGVRVCVVRRNYGLCPSYSGGSGGGGVLAVQWNPLSEQVLCTVLMFEIFADWHLYTQYF